MRAEHRQKECVHRVVDPDALVFHATARPQPVALLAPPPSPIQPLSQRHNTSLQTTTIIAFNNASPTTTTTTIIIIIITIVIKIIIHRQFHLHGPRHHNNSFYHLLCS
ncbi:hypothetical protein ElyMa_001309200 [Elysia marginata]|uniref:Uncharacterized protein n=1 Tax=Elysia marginata TaxID=1093978 RepID=A0AAV4IJJ3_9GAST|nr:hypothetical protein ElyMa_001309200 [Elysia marginata]